MRIFQHSTLILVFFLLTFPAGASGSICAENPWEDNIFLQKWNQLWEDGSFPQEKEKRFLSKSGIFQKIGIIFDEEELPESKDPINCAPFPIVDSSNRFQQGVSKNGKRPRHPLSRSAIIRRPSYERQINLLSPPPILHTRKSIQYQNLILRPASPNQDLSFGEKVFGDKEMMSYWENGQPKSRETVLENLQEWKGRALKGKLSWRVIIDAENAENHKPVGFFGTTFFNLEEEEFSEVGTCIEISYCLSKEARGNNYASRAVKAALRQALKHTGRVNYIRAHIHPDNINSIRFIEKLGFKDATPGSIHHYNEEYGENGKRKEFRLSYDDCCTLVDFPEPNISLDQERD